MSAAPEHVHQWQMRMHLDGCHFYRSVYACSCGASLSTYDERDVKSDPWSMMWMGEPEYAERRARDERGRFTGGTEVVEQTCDRCRELMDGAEPQHDRVMQGIA